ncbi:MAG: hypothetical protein MI794_08325 [Pseudomonadales bacterium]|nr:hypothetical protein [Pseudomonadales bacterium]
MSKWKIVSPTQGRLVFGRWAWLMAVPLMLVVIPLAVFGMPAENGAILGWATAATLAWHALFGCHKLEIDLQRGVFRQSIRSLYPAAQLEVPLADVAGFCTAASLLEARRYDLVLVTRQGQRLPLLRRIGRSRAETYGKDLAAFCDRPYRREWEAK